MNKRLAATLVTQVLAAMLIALNNKLGLGLDGATITTLAGAMGVSAATYMWSQAKTDAAENGEKKNA